jgi:hypothetical protein
MHFPHNGSIVTIDQLEYDNHHPNSAFVQDAPLYVPSIRVDSTSPQVNYVLHLILGVQFLLRRNLITYVFLLETWYQQLIHWFIQWG